MAAVEKGSAAYKAHMEAIEAARAFDDRGKKAWQKRGSALDDLAHQVNITGRNFAALVAGLPGDLGDILPGAGHALLANMPNSEEMAEKLGGDPEHWSWLPAALVAPGPGELKAMAGSGKALLAGEGGLLAQALFHGTPHKFDMFDLKKIGTGEGAQAYGHGLYFAESPGVAKSYAASLAAPAIKVDGKVIRAREMEPWQAVVYSAASDDDLAGFIARKHEQIAEGSFRNPELLSKQIDFAESLKGKSVKRADQSHLYEVDIPDETIAKMLDWDAPLSEQPPAIQKILDENNYSAESFENGEDLYKQFAENEFYTQAVNEGLTGKAAEDRGKELASKYFNEAGIPGIRYKAGQLSGGSGKTSNIVVFNPDDITQVKRDGELVYKAK